MIVAERGGIATRLGDIANVRDGTEEPRTLALFNDKEAVVSGRPFHTHGTAEPAHDIGQGKRACGRRVGVAAGQGAALGIGVDDDAGQFVWGQ
jgi:hypothetical protein